uniref:Uncharacterized protein n=1 Tax=Picea glauca TaxID=3330 RepID=A0A101LW95_PICGL|nr:hypothetical protein ABT39_MTgene1601 [Picea glauca]QHR89158.1 hypothetical protein Q903MT_gene3178 [Picea sitchensis]
MLSDQHQENNKSQSYLDLKHTALWYHAAFCPILFIPLVLALVQLLFNSRLPKVPPP